MFFSFSLFPPGISARCSRSALPPGFPPGIPSGGAWLAERFRAPSAFGGLSVFAGVSALRPFSAFPSAFPPGVWVALPPVIPGLRSARHFLRQGLARGAFPRSACLWGLVRFCRLVFCMRLLPHTAKTRLPESGRWLAALRRLPPGPFFRTGRRLRQLAESAPYGLQSYI